VTNNAVQKPTQDELKQAVVSNDVGAMKELLRRGADVNELINNGGGATLLMMAAFDGHREMAEFLIDSGADVNGENSIGWTALMNALSKGNLEIAQLLIDRGADIDKPTTRGSTAESWAKDCGWPEMQQLFQEARIRKQQALDRQREEREALDRQRECHSTALERQGRLKARMPRPTIPRRPQP
jgi:ankyrin repeat protein